jgi:predicted Zn-dependent protease
MRSSDKTNSRLAIRHVLWCAIAFTATLPIGGCAFSSDQSGAGEGPGKRSQDLALSPQEELAIGRQAYREVLNSPDKFGKALPADHPECQRVRRIVEQIVRAAEIEPLQREINLRKGYRFEWEANVLENNQVNAFCLPGGKVVVFRGLLRIAGTDDQLATVISHEIAHALAHHSSERYARMNSNRVISGAFRELAFDRQQETEADHIGLFLMTFADFEPDEAVRFWQKMQQLGRNQQVPEILSDHPSDAHRIEQMRSWIPYSKGAKQALEEGRIESARSD